MNYSPILIVAGEPNSIFNEIYFKTINQIKINRPLPSISSEKLMKIQMKKLNEKKIKILDYKKLSNYKLNNNNINLIDIKYNQKSI